VITLPEWLEAVPDEPGKRRTTERFYLKLASLCATESGTLTDLADLLDINNQTLKGQRRHITLPADVQKRIRRIVGRTIISLHVN
jgi:hypothetical protein